MPHLDPEVLDGILANLVAKAPNDAVRDKLRNLHAACRAVVLDGNVRPTVTAVVAQYTALFGANMAESSIRNKRGDWGRYAAAKVTTRNRVGEIVSMDELASIPDHGLRHRVALTMADNHHLRSRVNILEAVDKERAIVVEGLDPMRDARPARIAAPAPAEHDLDEIRDFLDQLRERGLVRRKDGALATDDGRLLADPGFLDSLGRMVAVQG